MADMKAAVSDEVVTRIEVSLSSRKSSVIVMRTMAKLYSLHNNDGDAEWKVLAAGVPCIHLQRATTDPASTFTVSVVVIELETGMIKWAGEVNHDSQYQAMQNNFHAFAVNKQTYALQFISLPEASRMLVSVRDYIRQKEEADIVSFNQSNQSKDQKKPKPKRRPSKKNISAPSNFRHVTSITGSHGENGELRKSVSPNDTAKPKDAGGPHSPTNPNPLYAEIGEHLLDGATASSLQKIGSMRLPKRTEEGDNDIDEPLIERGSLRHSLPSHFKQRARPSVNHSNFEPPTFRHPPPFHSSGQHLPTSIGGGGGGAQSHGPSLRGGGGEQDADPGLLLSSQPNLPSRVPPPSSSSSYHGHHQISSLTMTGGNQTDPTNHSLPRSFGGNDRFGPPTVSTLPRQFDQQPQQNNLRTLASSLVSSSMPSMERFSGPLPPAEPFQQAPPIRPNPLPPSKPPSGVWDTAPYPVAGGHSSIVAPPSFVAPPASPLLRRHLPPAMPVVASTPSVPSTPVSVVPPRLIPPGPPPPSAGLYDVLAPYQLQQPPPPAGPPPTSGQLPPISGSGPTENDSPPIAVKQVEARIRPQAYHTTRSKMASGMTESLQRGVELHATDV